MGQAFIVSTGGQIAADVSTPQGLYQVRSAGEDVYTISQIDPSRFPEELPPIEVGAAELQAAGNAPTAASDDETPAGIQDSGSIIDVLVLYTPAARQAQGGAAQIRSLINLAVIEANQSYANSGINFRLSLVYAGEAANYVEASSMEADLDRLRNPSDNFLTSVHSLRNQYKADLVSLVVSSNNYCGIAYHMATVQPAWAAWAFSVVSRSCAAGYYSFAHELGHNMGARHDWFVDAGVTPNSYSHGYVNPAARWRTIMAYDSECSSRGFSCTRLPYWSNPGVSYGGRPTGIRGGTNASCRTGDLSHPPCDADDHRTLNNSAYTVANFRVRTPPTPTPTPRPFWLYPFRQFLPEVRK
jgi:hypothetical protein